MARKSPRSSFCDAFARKLWVLAYLASAAAEGFVPAENWDQICKRLLDDPIIKERLAAKFLPPHEYATRELSSAAAQEVKDEVRQIRQRSES
jgi:hypothetical protein